MQRFLKNIFLYFILVVVVLVFIQNNLLSQTVYKEITFDAFLKSVDTGQVKSIEIRDKEQIVRGEYKDKKGFFETTYPEFYDVADKVADKGIKTEVVANSRVWLSVLMNLLPFGIIILLWFFMFQQMQGSGNKVMSFGKSRARKMSKDSPRVSFKDVAGLEEAIEELKEIKEYLSNPAKFQKMGAKIPKGILLYGPPGSGKTLLAKAVAGEARVPFFSISGSEFVEMFVGVGASRVRDLFEQAKASGPCIIFIDEIDAVGRHRGAGLGGGHDEREQTLNQLLVEMDGFDVRDNIILIAATNRPDILDPALLRPGRFDRHIVIDRPDYKGRVGILKVHAADKPLAKNVDLEVLAKRTPGFTGADLANLVNEGAILAARHEKKEIDMEELEEAIDRVLAGPEKKTRIISDHEKEIIAHHEVGHAVVAHILPETDPVHKISIIPRGRALGYTLTLPTEDRYLVSKTELMDDLAMILGGRVAELMVFGDVTTGAQDDLERATKIARKMVCEYGMSEKLGPMTLGQKQETVFLGKDFAHQPDYSPEIAFEIDKEIRRIVDEAFNKAKKILTENREKLDHIAHTLIEKETIETTEFESMMEPEKAPAASPAAGTGTEKQAEKAERDDAKKLHGKLRPAEG